MKCPKCGYNSFEIHDSCKKCAYDLAGYKNDHGLKSIVLPFDTRTNMAEKLMADRALDVQDVADDTPADMFSFDITEGEKSLESGSFLKDDPFDFGIEQISTALDEDEFLFDNEQISAQFKAEEEAYADFLESSSQSNPEPHSTTQNATENISAETELDNFSWDDITNAKTGESTKPAKDDFISLFGETNKSVHK